MILALYAVDCFGCRLAMTRGSVHKIFIVMLSEAKHLFWIPCSLIPSSYRLFL